MQLHSKPKPTIILILDEASVSTVYKPVTYTDFLVPTDFCQLILITSLNAASPKDKQQCLRVIEMKDPTRNGMLEHHAIELHREFQIDVIYTKQEVFTVN